MQITKEQLTPTKVKLTLRAEPATLQGTKDLVVQRLGRDVKVPGFRAGHAPQSVVEKNLDQAVLQTEVLDTVLNALYGQALEQERLRPVAQPSASIKKFVPFTELEAEFEVDVVGDVKLPDYKKIKLAEKPVSVTAKDVDEVITNLRTRAATRKEVERAAKDGDQVTLDFKGVDAKTKEPIAGADGADYPLIIGSNTFIPGFEPELIGLKPGGEKTFDIVFPKDYGTTALQNRKVTFTVTVKKVEELEEPKVDDAFAATVGPFKTVAELKADIKKQLQADAQQQARRDYESELLGLIAEKTKVEIPASLVDEEIDRNEADERQNLVYRGQTWEEHLKEEGVTAEEHRERQHDAAHARVKAGLALSEIADKEQISVTPEELDLRIQLLKGQYPDPKMQEEIDKPATRQELTSRIMTEKTMEKLRTYATKK